MQDRRQAGRADSDALDVVAVPVPLIDPNPTNPRRQMRNIEDLAASIAAYGLLQPLVVRPDAERFTLVAGQRRLAAVQSLGWDYVPAMIRAAPADEAYMLTLIENLQRNDLSPREEAQALEVLLRERGWSTRQVARAVYRSPAYVSKRLRVFEDSVLAPLVMQKGLSTSAAEEFLVLGPKDRIVFAERAVREGWEHPRVRAEVRACFESKRPRARRVRQLAHELRQSLQGVMPSNFTEAERRELRLLFQDLAVIARAPAGHRDPVFPPLPTPP